MPPSSNSTTSRDPRRTIPLCENQPLGRKRGTTRLVHNSIGEMSRPARPLFCDVSDAIYDGLQGGAFIAYLLFVLLASPKDYFCPDVFNRLDEDEPSFL